MSWLVTIVLVGCLLAYASNRVSLRTVSVATLASLALIQVFATNAEGERLPVERVFGGFASEALITIVCLMMLGHVLMANGSLRPIASMLSDGFARAPRLAYAGLLLTGFAVSGFINDTPVVVLLLPTVMAAAAGGSIAPHSMLMPMNFAVILGGMMTAIGTSTNLLVNSLSRRNGGPEFGFFDFYLTALPAAAAGLAYLFWIAPSILERGRKDATAARPARQFLRSLRIESGSFADGKALFMVSRRLGPRVKLRRLVRRGKMVSLFPAVTVRGSDLLVIAGPADALEEAERKLVAQGDGLAAASVDGSPLIVAAASAAAPASVALGLPAGALGLPAGAGHVEAEATNAPAGSTAGTTREPESEPEKATLRGEFIVTADSRLAGRTLKESAFESQLGVRVVGLADVRRVDVDAASADLRFIPIDVGDILLLEGTAIVLQRAQETSGLLSISAPTRQPSRFQALATIVLFAVVIVAAIAKVVPIAVAALCGVLACVLFRLSSWDELEGAINWRVILIVASAIALGDSLIASGALASTAHWLSALLEGKPVWAVIATILGSAGLLTNFVSNNAAAAILTPLALEVSRSSGVAPDALVLGVLLGANLCFLTPMAYQTNLLVMAAANYRFADFVRVGGPLFVIMVPMLVVALYLNHAA